MIFTEAPGRRRISTPLVSVLIRSTGRPDLQIALQSVAAQMYSHIEVLVADAAGTNTVDLAMHCANARIITTGKPLGRSAAANILLEQAQGRWALFLDDDDWIAPSHIQRLADALNSRADCVAAYSGVACVETVGQDEMGADVHRELRRYDDPFDANRLLVENFMPIHAVLFDLQQLRMADGVVFDESLDVFEDWDFWLKCERLGNFVHVPGVSAYYKIHTAGLGVRMNEDVAVAALDAVLERWRDRWTAVQVRTLVGLGRTAFNLPAKVADLEAQINEFGKNTGEVQSLLKLEHQRHTRALAQVHQRLMHEHQQHIRIIAESRELQEKLRQAQAERLALAQDRLLQLQAQIGELQQQIVILEGQNGFRGIFARLVSKLRYWGTAAAGAMDGWTISRLKVRASRKMLSMATLAYRSDHLAPLWRRVPFTLKRRVRDGLLRASVSVSQGIPPADNPAARRVSIVVPVYNHAQYLERCLRSALEQDWLNLEVVVVDDASTDPKVSTILDSLASEPRMTIVRHSTNRGIGEAQNSALEASSGQIIAFLDCDDYLAENAISRCMQAWQADTVYLHTGRINVDKSDREIGRIHFEGLPRKDYFAENLQAMYATHLKLIRRDVFAKVGLFDTRFDTAQDYEMLMRIAFHYPSSGFVHVPEFLYFHRVHDEQATERQRARQDALTRQIQSEARLRMDIRSGVYGRFLSFIMLSYGKHSQTLKAIKSLKATVKVPHEIILYDNGSAPETVGFIRTHIDGKFDDVRVIYGDCNLGPAQGRRKALDYARGEWFIVFDNDEWAEVGWLEELLLRAESTDNVGAVCCRVAFPDRTLQFSGGLVHPLEEGMIDLALHDRGSRVDDLVACKFRDVDWCPIGATLFTVDIRPFLHEGYPNVFEDAGVSFALKRKGLRLLNAPGALVWHDHVSFMSNVEMGEQYMRDRYNPQKMLVSIATFYSENKLLIHDEYVWRENKISGLPKKQVLEQLGFHS